MSLSHSALNLKNLMQDAPTVGLILESTHTYAQAQ